MTTYLQVVTSRMTLIFIRIGIVLHDFLRNKSRLEIIKGKTQI